MSNSSRRKIRFGCRRQLFLSPDSGACPLLMQIPWKLNRIRVGYFIKNNVAPSKKAARDLENCRLGPTLSSPMKNVADLHSTLKLSWNWWSAVLNNLQCIATGRTLLNRLQDGERQLENWWTPVCAYIQTQEFSMSIIRDADVIEDGHHRISFPLVDSQDWHTGSLSSQWKNCGLLQESWAQLNWTIRETKPNNVFFCQNKRNGWRKKAAGSINLFLDFFCHHQQCHTSSSVYADRS